LGPTTQKPAQIPLTEMALEEAAAYATSTFIDIALQAQSRKCKLYPSASDYTSSLLSFAPAAASTRSTLVESPKRKESRPELPGEVEPSQMVAKHAISPGKTISQKNASEEAVKTSHIKDSRKTGLSSLSGISSSKPVAPVRTQKGASLANPNKKARKYQALEFESDEE